MFDVPVSSEEVIVRGGGVLGLLIFSRPTDFGVIDAFAIEATHALTRSLDGFVKVRDHDARQQSDDANDYHDFDERESALSFCFHNKFWLWFSVTDW